MMTIERWRPLGVAEPFQNLSEFQHEVNRAFDSVFGRPSAGQAGRAWAPAVDMVETKDDLVLTMEVPGVSEKDVAVSITGDLVSVRGERRVEPEVKDQSLLHRERIFGAFERMVQLPMPVQTDKVKATYRDGLLEIRLPKVEAVKPREIKIDIL